MAVIQRPDQRQNGPSGLGQIDPRIRALIAGKIAALGQVLFAARRIIGQGPDHAGKSLHRRGVAFRVQRQGGFARRNVKQRLFDDIALVNPTLDHVPGDPMPRLAVQKRPDRGVQSGIARQGAVVKIDRTMGRKVEQGLRNDVQIGHAEQPVERGLTVGHPLHRQAVRRGPSGHTRMARDDRRYRVPRVQQHLPTVQCQRFIPDQQGGKAGHAGTFVSFAGVPGMPRSCNTNVRKKCGGSADF